MSKVSNQVSKEVYQAAAAIDDLDEAVRLVQDAVGIEDGGVAGIFFSSREQQWTDGTAEQRVQLLIGWLAYEASFEEEGESCTG